jgi:hypothetical protein
VALRYEARACLCGQPTGKYLPDGRHVVVHGPCQVLGMRNPDRRYAEAHPPTAPFQQDFPWFVIGQWPGCHVELAQDPIT